MTDPNASPREGARGPRLAAAAVLGLMVPFVLPIAVLAVAILDRRDMRHGRRQPEPPFLHRAAIAVSVIALSVQFAGLLVAGSVWSRYSEGLAESGAVGVTGDPCVAAERCCATLHGADAEECTSFGARAGQIQSTREGQMTAIERSVCTQALQSMRGELVEAERPVPEECGLEAGGGGRAK